MHNCSAGYQPAAAYQGGSAILYTEGLLKTELPRTLGLLDAMSIVIGITIGGGIFLSAEC